MCAMEYMMMQEEEKSGTHRKEATMFTIPKKRKADEDS